jgi:predicted TIM-barrel enzyme
MSYALKIDMIAKAREKDMLTTPYVFSEAEAAAMAIAGADIIVCHLGLTTGGSIGAQTALRLEDCPARIDTWAEAALSVNSKIHVLAHGGRSRRLRTRIFIRNTRNCRGFYGLSMERLPVELARIKFEIQAIGALKRIGREERCRGI